MNKYIITALLYLAPLVLMSQNKDFEWLYPEYSVADTEEGKIVAEKALFGFSDTVFEYTLFRVEAKEYILKNNEGKTRIYVAHPTYYVIPTSVFTVTVSTTTPISYNRYQDPVDHKSCRIYDQVNERWKFPLSILKKELPKQLPLKTLGKKVLQ